MNELNVNSVNLPWLGTRYALELENVECDPKIKHAIYKLANDLHENDKRLNDCIKTLICFSEALEAVGFAVTVKDKGYKKENQTGM